MRRETHSLAVTLVAVALWAGLGRGGDFALIDRQSGLGYGPYPFVQGTRVVDGRWTLVLSGNSVFLRGAETEQPRDFGPFVFTNAARLVAGGRSYEVMLGTADFAAGLEVGRQTRTLREAVAQAATNDDPRAAVAAIEQARASNALARSGHEAALVLKKLGERVAQEDALLASGKVKFEGQWLPKADAEARRLEREEETMRAQGLVKQDGEWMTMDAAAERRREQAAAAAKEAAKKRRDVELNKCRRCDGTGSIYFELRQSPASTGNRPPPPLRVERAGLPPRDARFPTERQACPDCDGTGRRK